MKNILIILILFSLSSKAQLDTLIIADVPYGLKGDFGFCAITEKNLTDSLQSKTFHLLRLTKYALQKNEMKTFITKCQSGYSKKQRKDMEKRYKINLDMLNSKLSQVKVLYIENPTSVVIQNKKQYINDTLPPHKINMESTIIGNMGIHKFKSLNVVYLHGNDTDDITELPLEMYTLPIKTIHISWLSYPDILTNTIKQNRPDIIVDSLGVINSSH